MMKICYVVWILPARSLTWNFVGVYSTLNTVELVFEEELKPCGETDFTFKKIGGDYLVKLAKVDEGVE